MPSSDSETGSSRDVPRNGSTSSSSLAGTGASSITNQPAVSTPNSAASAASSRSSRLTTDPYLDSVARRAMVDGSIAGLKMGIVTLTVSTLVRKTNWSPVYNGLTLQFRVFLHMAAIMAAGFTTAEHSLAAQRAERRRGGRPPYPRSRSSTPPSDSENTSPPSNTGNPSSSPGESSRSLMSSSPSITTGLRSQSIPLSTLSVTSPSLHTPSTSVVSSVLATEANMPSIVDQAGPVARAIRDAQQHERTIQSSPSSFLSTPTSSSSVTTLPHRRPHPYVKPPTLYKMSATDTGIDLATAAGPSVLPTHADGIIYQNLDAVTYPQDYDTDGAENALQEFQKQLTTLEKVNQLRLLRSRRDFSEL